MKTKLVGGFGLERYDIGDSLFSRWSKQQKVIKLQLQFYPHLIRGKKKILNKVLFWKFCNWIYFFLENWVRLVMLF